MDGTVTAAAAVGAVTTVVAPIVSWVLSRRKHRAEADKLRAEADQARAEAEQINQDAVTRAYAAVQEAYQGLIDQLRAQIAVSAEMVNSAQQAARESAKRSAESEHNAWRAEQQALSMARFLAEIRPVIAAYVPEAESYLERLDKLAASKLTH